MQILSALKTLFSQNQCSNKCPKLMGRCDAKEVKPQVPHEVSDKDLMNGFQKVSGEEEAFFYLNDFGF